MLTCVSSSALPPLVLVTGDEDLLVGRAVRGVLDAARARDPDVEIVDRPAGELSEADLIDLGATSMFGGGRVMVVRGAQDLAEDLRDALLEYIARPLDDVVLVVVHSGVVKNRKLADVLKTAGARVVPAAKITKPRERHDFVVAEVRHLGGRVSDGAVRALLDAVGGDLRELAAVCDQLVADTDGLIDEAAVARFHRGRAEASGFAVADAIIGGDLPQALTLLRQSLEGGTAAVLVSSAVAGGLRDLARVASAGPGSKWDLARALGMPDWKVEKAQRSARAWSDRGLGQALRAAAEADAGVKGAAVDAGYALEKLLREVAVARLVGRARAAGSRG
ncbi:DNA polymerase III subunit delta [Frankia sp. CcI156]|uniref:DNA-directed DNA polymerase n=1 Tax=Frankia casuarinae (strain DSM 45818 / CECT 9043 / HFP020203 / CcI3) TaxID=106370 RepID=Q2JDK5_FRACC|nr:MULTISPECIES: DNA polymerase III subunit delta [Frankia]ETA02900.1 DNA polymerase III, delta subunit [Frankia sp. CcI6]OHV55236.1 DNA polymerase III subunit delta [Frankia sp. CgIS1]ABD10637.1 DNA polymerase III, delta subunit [Frankia casuarinae]EYT93390.1 DNA polymerase III, delta subunit [Frankia casuarinae]KDA43509.1 DNA polymerase III, delta subunit [Frankia sp. BMG5.23]